MSWRDLRGGSRFTFWNRWYSYKYCRFADCKRFHGIHLGEARQMMEANFFGPAGVIRIVKPFMKRDSHVVNIAAWRVPGKFKIQGLSYYSASKAALACFIRVSCSGISWSGIVVNCLALGSYRPRCSRKPFLVPGSVTAREMAELIWIFRSRGESFITAGYSGSVQQSVKIRNIPYPIFRQGKQSVESERF